MSAIITYVSTAGHSYKAINGSGNTFWDLVNLPTAKGLLLFMTWGTATTNLNTPVFDTDGAPAESSLQRNGGSMNGQVFFWPNITDATQRFTITNSGAYTEGMIYPFSVDGHDTGDMFGSEWFVAGNSLSIAAAAGNAILAMGCPASQTFSGGGGSWATQVNTNSNSSGETSWNSTVLSGAQTINFNPSGTYLHVVEIKAAAGAAGGVPKTHRFLMHGVG